MNYPSYPPYTIFRKHSNNYADDILYIVLLSEEVDHYLCYTYEVNKTDSNIRIFNFDPIRIDKPWFSTKYTPVANQYEMLRDIEDTVSSMLNEAKERTLRIAGFNKSIRRIVEAVIPDKLEEMGV